MLLVAASRSAVLHSHTDQRALLRCVQHAISVRVQPRLLLAVRGPPKPARYGRRRLRPWKRRPSLARAAGAARARSQSHGGRRRRARPASRAGAGAAGRGPAPPRGGSRDSCRLRESIVARRRSAARPAQDRVPRLPPALLGSRARGGGGGGGALAGQSPPPSSLTPPFSTRSPSSPPTSTAAC